ncbi:hypothetical protein OIV83_005691 [Microbotryomycetes sp. JL201]|nr:hypothetical protein OIV83_005691 [Microbotryomycetes sp. JL201]
MDDKRTAQTKSEHELEAAVACAHEQTHVTGRRPRPHHAVALAIAALLVATVYTSPWSTILAVVPGCEHHVHTTPIAQPDTRMTWHACHDHPGFQCGSLAVPKDYFNSSAGVARIAMIKYPATDAHSKLGSLYLNPGGPGGSGVTLAAGFGPALSRVVNGSYDIIGFDPRGIGQTRPRVECFPSARAYAQFKAGTVLERGFEVPTNPSSDEGRKVLLRQHQALMALQETEFRKCRDSMGDELRYMGTPTVVRDIDYMNTVLEGKHARINYLGFSYGTILGAYLVNMLPAEKLGRIIIDGVASARQWANDPTYEWLPDWLVNTEDAFDWYARDCVKAGPKRCAVAKEGDSPSKLQKRLLAFLDELYENGPVAVPDAARPGALSSGLARTVLYSSTNSPALWPAVSHAFAQAMDGEPKMLYEFLVKPFPSAHAANIQTDLSRVAVSCLDSPPYKSQKQWPNASLLVDKTLAALSVSPHFAANVHPIEPDGGCQWWPVAGRAPERFTGPWNNTLDTPMLIVSNTVDPITPLTSGREIKESMGDSARLLVQNSVGHCSLSSVSKCTVGHYQRYLLHGELPDKDTLCEIDRGYFPDLAGDAELERAAGLAEDAQALSQAWVDFVLSFA